MDQQVEVLRARLAEISERCAQIQESADRSGRGLTRAENSEIETLFEEFETVEKQLATRERIANIGGGGRKTEPNPIGGGMPGAGGRRFDPRQCALTGGRYADLFGPVPNSAKQSNPFRSFGEYALAAIHDPLDPRLRQIRGDAGGMTEGVGEDGGFAVPLQFFGDLLDASYELEALRPRCGVIPMSSNMVVTPRFDYFDNTNAKRAGLTLQWADEGGTFTDQKAKVLPMTIRANKAGIFVRVTNEAAEDIPSFERRLQAAMVNAIAAGLDYAILWGTGAGTWLGVLQAPALIVVPKETASPQAADTLLEINIVKMAAALHPSCWRNAIWLCSPSTLSQLFQMSQAIGPYQGVRTAMITQTDQGLRILGKEVVVTDACAIVGDLGDLILGDFSKYVVGLRREARLETTIHANWATDEWGVRMILRAGAQPEWGSPVKLRTGDTVSSFVALEAR